MSNNITIRDSSGAIRTMKTIEFEGVHTPYQAVGSVEKKFRDSFPGTLLDASKWESLVGAGGGVTTSNGQALFTSGTVASSETSILSREVFSIPFRLSFHLALSQRIANQTFIVEAVSVNPITGVPNEQNGCGWLFDGTVVTNARHRVRTSGLASLDSAAVIVPTTAGGGVYEIEPFADECWFHGGTIDAVTGRANSYRRHQQIPDPNALYKIRIRWINGSVAPATTSTATMQFVAVQDYQEITAEITAGRGQTSAGQAIATHVTSMPSLTIGAMPASTVVRNFEGLGVATALGALNANIAQALLGAPGVGMVVTAVAAPVGVTLTPQVSYDGGTNWVASRFFNPVTEITPATLTSFAIGDSFGVLASDGATHVRIIASTWTSGSVTVRLSATNAQGIVNLKSSALHGGPTGDFLQLVGATGSADAPTAVTSGNAVRLWATPTGALNVADGGGSITVDGAVTASTVSQDNVFFNESTVAQAASATATGASRDVGAASGAAHRYGRFHAAAWADQAGSLRVEMSNDNITWRRATPDTALAANTTVTLSVPVLTRFYRSVYANGAVAQTAFMLNSSFTSA